MNDASYNPFLEGSEPVPDEEAVAAAKALYEEAALKRAKTSEIKERAAKARAEKEAARKAEILRVEAEIEAARARLVKTVASIPKRFDRPTIRPVPPDLETVGPGSSIASGSGGFFSSDHSTLNLIADAALAAIAVTFTFLIFNNL